MPCNHAKSRLSLLLLTALLAGFLAACGGDEPAPAPPPPPAPPPRPAFVPKDVPIDLGTSGEQVTLQTTEAGGYTLNGEAFASGTTVEAGGNTYRLTLADDEWTAEYVPPRPWATALGTSGDALLITRREDGLFEAGDNVFSSGGTVTATNGNQYRLTLNEDTNSWQVEFLPPEPTAVLLGMSGETVLVERLEGGGYAVGGQRVVDGSTVTSVSGATYRLAMQDGVWTASFIPGPPVTVSLGASGQTVTLQLGEDGNYQRDGQPIASGTEILAAGNLYRLTLADGQWTAEFVAPPPVRVQLGTSGQTVTLQRREDGQYYRNGQLFTSGTTVDAGGETYELTLQAGQWTAMAQAPVLQSVRLGTSDVTLTLRRSSDGAWTEDGVPVRDGEVRRVGDRRYRLLLEDGEWSAEFLRDTIPVEGAGGLIILFREEDGSLTYNGQAVRDGSTVTQDGRTYELLELSDGTWLATPGAPPPTGGDQNVSLPGGQTITLRRTSRGTYTYDGNPVSNGSQITVGGNQYRLTQDSDGRWSAVAVSSTLPPTTVNPGTIGGPTQTDMRDDFTDGRLDNNTGVNEYGVEFVSRSQPTKRDTGTMIVPIKLYSSDGFENEHQFSVYELMQSSALAPMRRTAAEVAKASLEEIIAEMDLKKPLYNSEAVDSGIDIGGQGGLWEKAQDAVGRIFGYTRAANATELGEILGDDPWRGGRVDPNEVDDVINALQRMVGVLSDATEFAAEFETQINSISGHDADDFFSSIASRVRFGSTSSTRYGVYAVTADGTHSAQEQWDTGVFLYTPLDAPRASSIPDRGSATFNGNTVAVLNGSGAGGPDEVVQVTDPRLYAGKISLDVSFSQTRVTGVVTDLKDEDGNPLRLRSTFTFRDETVVSITLPDAVDGTGVAARDGLYTSTAADSTISFGPSIQTQDSASSVLRVQLVNDATEALGIWRTGGSGAHLEGAFGATRSGTVTTPRLPTESDRGSHVAVSYVLDTLGTFTDTDGDGKYTFTLTQSNIGSVGPTDGLSFETERLYSSSSHPERGSTYISEIRSAINSARSGLADDNFSARLTDANNALERIVSGFPDLTASDLAEARAALNSAYSVLGSERSFFNAVRAQDERNDNVAEDGIFSGATDYSTDQIGTIFDERTIDFRLRTARTTYTRFGVWSQRSADTAEGNAVGTNSVQNGSFAFGPRTVIPEASAELTFVAEYSGRTLAVEADSGNLYAGSFELRVDWAGTAGNVSATITDLRGIDGTSSLFRHNNRDVKSIFLTGMTETNGTISSGNPVVQVRYTDRSVTDATFGASGATMAGGFIGNSTEGPIGVLGTWSIPADGTMSKIMRGSFGADLRP